MAERSLSAAVLGRLPLFAGLTEVEAEQIAFALTEVCYSDGELLCEEGQSGRAMFIIAEGMLHVRKQTAQGDQQLLAAITAPSVIGEMALLDGAPRDASVCAVGAVRGYSLSVDDFVAMQSKSAPVAYKLVHNLALVLCERLRTTNHKIDEFFAEPAASLRSIQERRRRLWSDNTE